MLVRLVRYLNFWSRFVSEVASDFRQSSQDNRWLPAANDSPGPTSLTARYYTVLWS